MSGEVSWAEVEHWLWPLFTKRRWGAWRQERLGLPPVPYVTEAEAADVPLPAPPPLLLAVSELVVPRPGYWPASVEMTGFLSSPACEVSFENRVFQQRQFDIGNQARKSMSTVGKEPRSAADPAALPHAVRSQICRRCTGARRLKPQPPGAFGFFTSRV